MNYAKEGVQDHGKPHGICSTENYHSVHACTFLTLTRRHIRLLFTPSQGHYLQYLSKVSVRSSGTSGRIPSPFHCSWRLWGQRRPPVAHTLAHLFPSLQLSCKAFRARKPPFPSAPITAPPVRRSRPGCDEGYRCEWGAIPAPAPHPRGRDSLS